MPSIIHKLSTRDNHDCRGLIIAGSLFSISAAWMLRHLRRQHELEQASQCSDVFCRRRASWRSLASGNSVSKFNKNSGECEPAIAVGTRGQAAIAAPAIPYLNQFTACQQDEFHPISNQSGHIALCVAENRLVFDMLAERFINPGTSVSIFSDIAVYGYNAFTGMPVAREAAAYFIARRFLFPEEAQFLSPERALRAVQPSHVALGTGCAALLNHLFFILGEEGRDCCLIPLPYYAPFENNMNIFSGIIPFGVASAHPEAGPPTVAELNVAYGEAKAKGLMPKFILLTNPNNPLGVIYPPDKMKSTIQWARQKGMHIIVDEVYGLSTHEICDPGFQSVIKILDNNLGNDVHFLWAVSKDFGAGGLRVGTIYSQNEVFMKALSMINVFTCVSGPIQYLVSQLLTDDVFVNSFMEESRARLRYSYQICCRKLKEMVLPYVQAEAGIFVYVDFSSLLPEKTFAWEARLSHLMFEYARVVLTPGQSQRDPRPGMFRICYAWVLPEVLEVALERLSRLVAKIRRLDWEDLNSRTLTGII